MPLTALVAGIFIHMCLFATSLQYICDKMQYDYTTHRCCGGQIFKLEHGQGRKTHCCHGEAGSSLYNRMSEYCCYNGLVLEKYRSGQLTDERMCTLVAQGIIPRIAITTSVSPSASSAVDRLKQPMCGSKVFNPEKYTCCDGPTPSLVYEQPSKVVCCYGDGYARNKFPCLHEALNDRLCSPLVNLTKSIRKDICKKQYVFEIKIHRRKSTDSTIKVTVREWGLVSNTISKKKVISKVMPIDRFFPCPLRKLRKLNVFSDVPLDANSQGHYIYPEDIVTKRIKRKRFHQLRQECSKSHS